MKETFHFHQLSAIQALWIHDLETSFKAYSSVHELTEQSQVKGDIKLEEMGLKGWEVLVRLLSTTFSEDPSLQGPWTCLMMGHSEQLMSIKLLWSDNGNTVAHSFCICFGDMEGQTNLYKKDVEVSITFFPSVRSWSRLEPRQAFSDQLQ